MKDDSLSNMQQNNYCPKCDKYYDYKIDCSVGICNCAQPLIEYGYCTNCRKLPRTKTMDKLAAKVNDGYNVYATRIWNEAIEAAAKVVSYNKIDSAEIRKLKK